MLTLHTCGRSEAAPAADMTAAALPPGVVWIDLLDASGAEREFVERATGLHLPGRDELSEIESSSRLRSEKGALYLSTPMLFRSQSHDPVVTPVGFVLTRDLLITIRFAELNAFTSFAERAAKPDAVHRSSGGAFVGLAEAVVDRQADLLETLGAELDVMSRRLFRAEPGKSAEPRRPAREEADLRAVLRRVGRAGDLASKIRDSMLGIGRIVPYVAGMAADWLPPELKPRLDTLQHDLVSLSDYDAHLTNKVQLLLDATLGQINIEQNNIIKVLTIVSVVGVPPTLVASLYGMNFHHMPELDWAWGYQYGLALILFSAVAPLLWFKLRGWF